MECAITNAIIYTCCFPAMTSQNVCSGNKSFRPSAVATCAQLWCSARKTCSSRINSLLFSFPVFLCLDSGIFSVCLSVPLPVPWLIPGQGTCTHWSSSVFVKLSLPLSLPLPAHHRFVSGMCPLHLARTCIAYGHCIMASGLVTQHCSATRNTWGSDKDQRNKLLM